MNIELKPLINMLRRATRCGFPSVVVNNRMFMQCYDLDIDSEVGMNYVLHVPDDVDPGCGFYETPMIIKPRDFLKAYSDGHKSLIEERKHQDLKPKAMSEWAEYIEHKHHIDLIVHHCLLGEEFINTEYRINTNVPETTPIIDNVLRTYGQLIGRIKVGGTCVRCDGSYMGLQDRVVNCQEIYRYRMRINGHRVDVPFTKSMFLGIRAVEQFHFAVQESSMDDIYIYSIGIEHKGIMEQFWGYLLQYE